MLESENFKSYLRDKKTNKDYWCKVDIKKLILRKT